MMLQYSSHVGGGTLVINKSMVSREENCMVIEMPLQDFVKSLTDWKGGMPIQNAFPDLNGESREFIKTGITPKEWKKIFG
jgi:hypothetical protein